MSQNQSIIIEGKIDELVKKFSQYYWDERKGFMFDYLQTLKVVKNVICEILNIEDLSEKTKTFWTQMLNEVHGIITFYNS